MTKAAGKPERDDTRMFSVHSEPMLCAANGCTACAKELGYHAGLKDAAEAYAQSGDGTGPELSTGTFSCPICGVEKPHAHEDRDIVEWLNKLASGYGVTVVDSRWTVKTRTGIAAQELAKALLQHFIPAPMDETASAEKRRQTREARQVIEKWLIANAEAGTVEYWKSRAETAELKVLTFHEGIAKLIEAYAQSGDGTTPSYSKMLETVRWIASQTNFLFAECSLADEIVARCKEALAFTEVPKAYMCPHGCGCLWRDNRDGTMSLYGPNSKSCAKCEIMALNQLTPVLAGAVSPEQGKPPDVRDRLIENQRLEFVRLREVFGQIAEIASAELPRGVPSSRGATSEPKECATESCPNPAMYCTQCAISWPGSAPEPPSQPVCPKCHGEIKSGAHGSWCPKPTCKWGWEIEMDGSPLQPPVMAGSFSGGEAGTPSEKLQAALRELLMCTSRTCAEHRDIWRHYEDVIAQNADLREQTKQQALAERGASPEQGQKPLPDQQTRQNRAEGKE